MPWLHAAISSFEVLELLGRGNRRYIRRTTRPISSFDFLWAFMAIRQKPRLKKSERMSMHIPSDFLRRGF